MLISLFNLLRALVGIIDLVILTVIMYLLSFIPKKLWGGRYNLFHKLFRYWCHVFIRALRVNLFCHQKFIKPLPKQYILIGNHPSCLEDIGMPALFDARFLAKIEVKDWFIVGKISEAANTLYVKRECRNSRKDASESILKALNEGDSIGLYPEGGCKGRRIYTPFRYGAFDLAIKSGVPILPVFLHHEAQQDFEWQNQHLLYKLWMIFTAVNRRVNYYVYDAIDPKNFTSAKELCEHVEQLYLDWQKKYLD